MGIYKDLKKAVISTVDVLADKTSTQAQKSRLVTVMKNEEKIANQAYLALGKYLYSTLREGMPEDVEQLCAVIDASKERMTRAQEAYRHVIDQEQIKSTENRKEVKENFRKVKEPIVSSAASTAAKASILVKDTAKGTAEKASNFKAAAASKAENIRAKLHQEDLESQPSDDFDMIELETPTGEIFENVTQPQQEETQPAEISVLDETSASTAENEETEPTNPTTDTAPQESEIQVPDTAPESAEEDDGETPMPMDNIFSDEELEENESVVKPIEKNPLSKAKKLRDIITKKDDNNQQ